MIEASPHPEDPTIVVLVAPNQGGFAGVGLKPRRDRYFWRLAIAREDLADAIERGLRVTWPKRTRAPALLGRLKRRDQSRGPDVSRLEAAR